MTLLSIVVSIHTLALAQPCSNIYVFDPGDKKSHAIISREPVRDEVIANGRAAAVQTFELPVNWQEAGKDATLKVHGLFECSPNLEPRDFVWVYFNFNGKKVKTVTVNGAPGTSTMRILDSLQVPFGTKVTMRAAMVCDQPDEFISLKKGYLELCQMVDPSDSKPKMLTPSDPEDIEPLLQISNIDHKVKLSWKSGANIMPNFFKVERTDGNGSWEVAGFVKDHCPHQVACDYAFIDTHPHPTTVGYRIVRVDQKGKEFMLTEEARPIN